MTTGLYKLLRLITSNIRCMLDLSECYPDLPLLQEKDIYLMQAFINNKYKSADLKCLDFVWKYIQAVSLADISTVDGRQISYQAFEV